MPLPLLTETLAEKRWREEQMKEEERGTSKGGGEALAKRVETEDGASKGRFRRRKLKAAAGFDAWLWLVVMITNYMFAGGPVWQPRNLEHLGRRTEHQGTMLDGHRRRVARFLGAEVTLTPERELGKRLGPGGQSLKEGKALGMAQGKRGDRSKALPEEEG